VPAEDPEEAQDRDRAAEEALGRDLERDRGPVEGRRQDLVNSFRLEVLQRTDGCLFAVIRGAEKGWFRGNEMEKRTSGPKGQVAWVGLCTG